MNSNTRQQVLVECAGELFQVFIVQSQQDWSPQSLTPLTLCCLSFPFPLLAVFDWASKV